MTAVSAFTNVVGLHAVTADGVLGTYADGNQLIPDPELTLALGPHVRQLLAAYLADPSGNKYRLGLVCHPPEPRPWSSDTFLLEQAVVRELYPVGGPANQELTAFQKKNREKSIYRAIELLIEYRHDTMPDDPVYCPLLYDCGTALQDYPANLGFGGKTGARVPVIEVLNLIPTIPLGRRNIPALAKLISRMQQYVVQKSRRRDDTLAITERDYVASPVDLDGEVEFFDVDKRHQRQQTLEDSARMAARRLEIDRFDQVERWLERPHRAVDAALLRSFAQFRDLDMDRLSLLAGKALVYTAPSGVQLLNIGMKDSWNMYLLEGSLSLEAADGGKLLVTGGTDKAASPVSFLKPRKYKVTSLTPVSFLWIHDAVLDAVLIPPDPKHVTPALKPR